MTLRTIAVGLFLTLATSIAHAQPAVTTAELFAGNPVYDEPKDRAKEGQGLRDDPPLAWRTLLFVGDKLVTTVGQEIWFTDLSEAKPVVKRLAGKEDRAGQSLRPGPGRDARFANIFGLALLPDGSLVGADQTGNCIFQVKDPFGPGCAVSLIAGTTKAQESVSPGNPPNVGDVDGPGASARFGLPMWPATIGDATYFIDEGNSKLKQVAGDGAHTVKTITKLPDGSYYAMISLNGKLYTLANNTMSEGFILEIDPATGAIREVVKGRSDKFEGDGAINVSGLATDGKGLFTSQSGQLLYVTLDGQVKSIAGTGDYFDFRQPYDPTKPQPADKVQLVTMRRVMTAGSNVFLGYKDNAVYFSSIDTTPYVERLTLK
ncbi:MAG: hypothetical protein JO316_20680 [Abitibacteriaceae bacterium]|nr:hypothetical protein [Abditibacteriaceae bacterium]MBV9867775.1 hypothetical protein [Abditibacteriaceae bacterium]